MNLFFELHRDLPREGPGDDATTARVLEMIAPRLPQQPEILDIGCGPGMQTLVLARHTNGTVTGLDVHQPFLDELARRAAAAGLAERIRTQRGSMTALPLVPGSFDLIWSEGAVWIMGFAAGLHAWRRYLRRGGILVVSELTWLTENPAEAERAFWAEAYPAMQGRVANRAAIAAAGYELIAEVDLPHQSWFDGYLDPLERRIDELSRAYAGDVEALVQLEAERREVDIVRRYRGFGYVFYAMRRD